MDYNDKLGAIEIDLFYDSTRALVVVFLLFSFIFPLSYLILTYLRNAKESPYYKDDIAVHRFVLGACTYTLALNLTMIILLPFSLIANEILVISPESYYGQWINTALLNALFVSVTFGGKIVCILLPFCFFLLSSHSVFRGKKAVTSRFLYSSVYLSISYVAFFGSLITIALIISMFSNYNQESSNLFTEILPQFSLHWSFSCYSWPIRFLGECLCYCDAALVVLQQIISYVGLFLLLICMPYGIICIVFLALKISTNNKTQQSATSVEQYCLKLIDDMYYVKLRKCTLYIETIHVSFSSVQPPLYDPLSYKLGSLHVSHPDSVFRSSHSTLDEYEFYQQINMENTWLSRETKFPKEAMAAATAAQSSACLPLLLLSCLFIFLVVGAAYTMTNIFVILYGLIFGNPSTPPLHASTSSEGYEYLSNISIGQESASKFGCIGALFQLLLVLFMVCTSIFGFYSLPVIRKYVTPTPHETKLLKTLANCVCLLFLSSALPMQASLLGLADPPFPIYSISLTENFCKTAHNACLPSLDVHSSSSNTVSPSWMFPSTTTVHEASSDILDPDSSKFSSSTPSVMIYDDQQNDYVNFKPSAHDQECSVGSSENPSTDVLQSGNCKGPTRTPSVFSAKMHSQNTPCAYFPTYILAFFYIGFHSRNCRNLMALSYNIGFLLTSYWLFKRHLHNCSQLLNLKADYEFMFRWIFAFVRLRKRNSHNL